MDSSSKIPISFLSKMGKYDVELEGGVKIKATVLDRAELVDSCVSQLMSSLARPVVGFDGKGTNGIYARLLVLYAENHCLIIQLDHLDKDPGGLAEFLADETICFVCAEEQGYRPYTLGEVKCVEVAELAARVLKKPSLINCTNLKDLAREAGLDDNEIPPTHQTNAEVDWGAKVFSHEQIKLAIQDAYASYVIGNKLLGML